LVGIIFLSVYFVYKKPEIPKQLKVWKVLFVVGMINTAFPFLLISWGEIYIDSAVASILNGSVPLFSAVIAHYFLQDDRLSTSRVIGLLIGFAGVVVLVTRDMFSGLEGSLLGQGAVLLAALLYAISAVYIRRNTADVSPVVRALIPMAAADAMVWLAIPFAEAPLRFPQLTLTWIAILWLGIIGSFLAYLLYYYLVHSVGPTKATLITFTFPLVGLILGVAFLGEVLDLNLVLGGGLILGSLAIVNRQS
jgi:drug/metabolite transporter (DMT)-like permease